MPRHPFEASYDEPEPDDEPDTKEVPVRIARPMPCPQCESTKGYDRVGNFRSRCRNCRSLLANNKIDIPNLNQNQESE